MVEEYSAEVVACEVLAHLERHRPAIVGDERRAAAAVRAALARVERAYCESGLPLAYLRELLREMETTLPAQWRAVAVPFTAQEERGFGVWRRGDLISRVAFMFGGLALGGLCVAAPFIPIWSKWFPFAVAIAGWWLPDAQAWFHRRRYARQLGSIVRQVASVQPALERAVSIGDLLPDPAKDKS